MVKFPVSEVVISNEIFNRELERIQIVTHCQEKTVQIVSMSEKTSFGQRFRLAFGNAKYAEIARKIGVSTAAIKNYAAGRVPDDTKLILISKATNCNLHWLLTGDGPQIVPQDTTHQLDAITKRLKLIADEQGHLVYSDAEIAGGNLVSRTLDLLTEFLICRALASSGLIGHETELMSKADYKRAQKFTFVANAPSTLEDRIREIVSQTKGSPIQFDSANIRDIIREILIEEIETPGTSRPRELVTHIEIHDQPKRTRKTG